MPMRTLRSVGDLRAALAPVRMVAASRVGERGVATVGGARPATTIGLVPTMGALHEGHLSLIRLARSQCDVVVVSLFVNPSQFDEHADLERYPRSEDRDAALAAEAGADILFAPTVEEVYPEGFATAVEVLGVSAGLEGEVRGASHFRGVTTVVTKLLSMVAPDVAYFGQKDAQQLAVVRRLVADLDLPVAIEVGATVREADGLALSSRNALLDPDARARARALFAALLTASDLAAAGERSAGALRDATRDAMAAYEVEPEYVALVDPDTFERLDALDRPALLVLAARVGGVRLIDNMTLEPAAGVLASAQTSDNGKAMTTCSA
jgi:pantoate--beta-alanine ligase